MSSRLLSMKFMQRAAASGSSSNEPSNDGRPSKRQKYSNSAGKDSDLRAAQAAVAAEEAKRDQALQRQAAEAGDTRWILSFKGGEAHGTSPVGRQIISAGYASIDGLGQAKQNGDDSKMAVPGKPETAGRKSFGKFNRGLEKSQKDQADTPSSEEDDVSVSNSSGDSEAAGGEEDPNGPDSGFGSSLKHNKSDSKAGQKATRQARKAAATPNNSVQLGKLTSISGGGGGGKINESNVECYECGEKGHIAKNCTGSRKSTSRKRKTGEREPRSKKKPKKKK
ncbi:MAG: hypothetical protein M4579_003712 [Chaenotheca gracillima]|nr:MAG: hypothetical protein M4579_003712 [Chaenotheca gracillima]